MRIDQSFLRCLFPVLLLIASNKVSWADGPVKIAALTHENWDQLVPQGKEVDAIVGDVVIRNDHLIAVIAQPLATRNANMTVRDVGGCLIDLTSTEFPSDQLSCYYPGRREFPYRSWKGANADGGELLLDGTVHEANGVTLMVMAEGGAKRPTAMTAYVLTSTDRALTINSVLNNTGKEPLSLSIVDDLRADGGKEEMQKKSNGTAESFWFDDHYWQQAYVVDAPRWTIESTSDSRTTTLKFATPTGEQSFESPQGEGLKITRRIAPGRTLLHAFARLQHGTETRFVNTSLKVLDQSGAPVADARVTMGDAHLRTDSNGSISFPITAGNYNATIHVNGVELLKDHPLTVSPGETSEQSITLKDYHPGTVIAAVTDGEGQPIPCKVEFIPIGSTPLPNFGPETAEFAVKNLRYTPDGTFQQSLHPGQYECLVSHGPEFEIAVLQCDIAAGQRVTLRASLTRSVDTRGWVSADYHSHSSPSGDNTGSQLGRVLNLVCEHIEFAPCTEHNRISTYADHIERLKISPFIASCSGMELTGTPLPLNHQNTFPLIYHPREQDGGGPVTDGSPEVQIERLALWDNRSEKFLQQNHPDLGWLFFDKNGDGIPDEGFSRSFDYMDAIEIHPIDSAWNLTTDKLSAGNPGSDRILHWLQLLNLGRRAAGVVNTDAHYNFHGSGGLRNWVKSPTDNPPDVQVIDMVHASEQGHLVMTNGPFLEVSTTSGNATFGPGDDITDEDGKLQLKIKVQSPSHIAVDEVFILLNGKAEPAYHFTRTTHPKLFTKDICSFDQTVELALKGDTHLVVVAGSRTATLGRAFGPDWGKQHPTAMSNPIFVDVDGNGFQSNKDSLGLPLPVKGGTPKPTPAPDK